VWPKDVWKHPYRDVITFCKPETAGCTQFCSIRSRVGNVSTSSNVSLMEPVQQVGVAAVMEKSFNLCRIGRPGLTTLAAKVRWTMRRAHVRCKCDTRTRH